MHPHETFPNTLWTFMSAFFDGAAVSAWPALFPLSSCYVLGFLCKYHLFSSAYPDCHSLPPSKSLLIVKYPCLATQLLLKGKQLIFIHLDIFRI